jgi:hypothetical protein
MVHREPAWTFEHSLECEVSLEFAWAFWTNVKNWVLDADIESVEIDGPFTKGARGLTKSKSSGHIPWRVADVQVGRAVIEFPMSGVLGRCIWTFAEIAGRTRITQRWTLEGEQADACSKAIAAGLESGIRAGMDNLCSTMKDASRVEKRPTSGE